jgi:hypothetical protein
MTALGESLQLRGFVFESPFSFISLKASSMSWSSHASFQYLAEASPVQDDSGIILPNLLTHSNSILAYINVSGEKVFN